MKNFEIGKVLGKGSFGSVCIVTRKQDKKIYAMKRFNLCNSPKNEIESALNEVRLLYSLNHPNIIGYKDAFYDNPSFSLNIVMEFADGGDLSKSIEFNKKKHLHFEEKLIWEWISQLLNGLLYLHTNHIMHRDLKSANIFLMKNGLLKIGDLNVSKLSKNNYARTKTGTPYYLAPEVWEDKPYDYKCDIWSLGCIIYELCTLSPPFRGKNFKELFSNIKNGYYNPISNYYSDDLKQVIGMMLKTNPINRPSAKELLDCNIIKNRIKNKEIISKKESCFIGTIKIPRNIKDINRVLPHERYQMGENDPYETMKKTIKLMQNNNDQNPNQKLNIKPLNNYDRELANQRKKINQNDNYQKPIIISNDSKNNKEYNIFNQNKNGNCDINNNFYLNKNNNINDKKININDINKNKPINIFEEKKTKSKKEENGLNTNQKKQQEQFDKIKQQFVHQSNGGNKKIKSNQHKVNEMKNRRPPSGQPRNKYNGNNNINDSNQKNRNNKININNKNRNRPNSQYQNRIIVNNNNNVQKHNYNGNIKRYEIKNHIYEHNGQAFEMNPYKRGNKAIYKEINVKEYKEKNKMKFNKYLYNGGRVKNDNEYKKQIKNERQRKNPYKNNNMIHRDGRFKK